jgi:hypothetical protein
VGTIWIKWASVVRAFAEPIAIVVTDDGGDTWSNW